MEHAGTGLEKIVSKGLRQAPPQEAPLLAWPVACGHTVAQRTQALDFAEGVLRVEVPDRGWRTELQALAPQYVAVMNRYVSSGVKRIEFVVKEKAAADRSVRARRA